MEGTFQTGDRTGKDFLRDVHESRGKAYPRANERRGRERRMARPPLFVRAQAECATCGAEIRDLFILETLGRYCSPRCLHAAGLPQLLHHAA